jgi:hypothetical protein
MACTAVPNGCCCRCCCNVQEVLASPQVAPVTTKLECAKLADGAAALLLVPAAAAGSDHRGIATGLVIPDKMQHHTAA